MACVIARPFHRHRLQLVVALGLGDALVAQRQALRAPVEQRSAEVVGDHLLVEDIVVVGRPELLLAVVYAVAVLAVGAESVRQRVAMPHLHPHHQRRHEPAFHDEGVGRARRRDGGHHRQHAVLWQPCVAQQLHVAVHYGLGGVLLPRGRQRRQRQQRQAYRRHRSLSHIVSVFYHFLKGKLSFSTLRRAVMYTLAS